MILLDFSTAFDTFDKVDHKKLISKLHFYRIRGKILSWVKDFLDSHSQAVVLNGVKSDKMAVSSAGLSPWTHTLPRIIKYDLPDQVKSRVRFFADDMADT